MKIYQSLEKIFKYRILSNDDIPRYMKEISQRGKLDQPKINAIMVMILVRLAELEDAELLFPPSVGLANSMLSDTLDDDKNPIRWQDLMKEAKALGVFKVGLNREQLETVIQDAKQSLSKEW